MTSTCASGGVCTNYTYDANGNMATKVEAGVTTAYTYDAENRLIKVTKNGSTIAQYEYDGDGGRTKKTATVGTTTTVTTYVGSLFETDNKGRSTKYIFLGDQRVASITQSPTLTSNILYYHADHLGGANVLIDANGLKKELIEYEPFGQESRHEKYSSVSSEEIAWYYFTGKPKDDESGLYYYGARYYDPALGRFIQADSVVPYPYNPQALNRYSYAGNNPVSHLEDGHGWFKKFWKSLVGGVVGAVVGIVSGNPWLGFSAYNAFTAVANGGNVGAAVAGGLVGYFGGGLIGNAFGNFWGVIGAGVLGGASGAAIGGGNVGLAALSGLGGSLAGYGVGAITGFAGLGTIIGGGVGSEISGGDFGEGALGGLAYNIGFTIGSTFAPALTPVEQANVEAGDQVFFAGERLGKGKPDYAGLGKRIGGGLFSAAMAVLDPGPFNHTGIGLGNGQIADSHPDRTGQTYNGPGMRSLKGSNQFGAYAGEKVMVIKHSAALATQAQSLITSKQAAQVTFGWSGPKNNEMYCSQFTGEVHSKSSTGVYGNGPNSQRWYSK